MAGGAAATVPMAVAVPLLDELTAVLAASPAALVTRSSDGIVLSANPAAVRLFARPRKDLEGSHWHEWLSATASARTRARIEHLLMDAGDATAATGTDLVFTTRAGAPRAVTMSCGDYWYGGERRLVVSLMPRPNPGERAPIIMDQVQANAVLVDQAAVGMTLTDATGRWLRLNEAYAAMLGYAVDELMDMGFVNVTHPDDRILDERATARLKAREIGRFSHEKRYVHRDGTIFRVRVHVNGVFDAGKLVYWASQVINIDAQHQAVENNRVLQLVLQSFIEHVPANTAVKDRDGRDTLVNKNFANAVGRELEEFRGHTLAVLGIAHPTIMPRPG
jgi:PAS domain S-box-containing protein